MLEHLHPAHVVQADGHGTSVGLELLHLGELHDGLAYIPQSLSSQVTAGNVLDIGTQVHARVLLCVAICGWEWLAGD